MNNLEHEGLQLGVYVNNEYYCAKDLILLPNQACPEHKHPPRGSKDGKTETFRCRFGEVWLYIEGSTLDRNNKHLKNVDSQYYKAGRELHLTPGDQFTIQPNTYHWFVAGKEGAIISEFSTPSDDASDIFRNPNVVR